MPLLQYRAGVEALAQLRTRGLDPAAGSGRRRLLLFGAGRHVLARNRRRNRRRGRPPRFVHVDGYVDGYGSNTSIGAWRALALAARDPRAAHARLLAAYCAQRFTHADSPAAISGAYRQLLAAVSSPEDISHALAHPRFDLAIATARARGLMASERRATQSLAFSAAGLLNAFSPRALGLCFERSVFATGQAEREYPLLREAGGVRGALNERNVRELALASGTVPMYMQPVLDPPDVAPGAYVDGGFSDYHLNRSADAGAGLSVLFLHQRRIVPAWFDKFVPWRTPEPASLARLLLVYPDRDFVRSLPGAAVPTRDDFQRYVHEPDARIARWHEVAVRSRELARTFLDDVTSGTIAGRAKLL